MNYFDDPEIQARQRRLQARIKAIYSGQSPYGPAELEAAGREWASNLLFKNTNDMNPQRTQSAQDETLGLKAVNTCAAAPEPTDLERYIRATVVIDALREDHDAARSISERRVDKIATLTLEIDSLRRQYFVEREAQAKIVEKIIAGHDITADPRAPIAVIRDLVNRLVAQERALATIQSFCETILSTEATVANVFTPPAVGDKPQPTLRDIFEAIHDRASGEDQRLADYTADIAVAATGSKGVEFTKEQEIAAFIATCKAKYDDADPTDILDDADRERWQELGFPAFVERQPKATRSPKEYDRVLFTTDVNNSSVHVPAGSKGVIVHCYAGSNYEVRVSEVYGAPVTGLVTVTCHEDSISLL